MDEQLNDGAASIETVGHQLIKKRDDMSKRKSAPSEVAGSEGIVEHLLIDNRTGIILDRRVSHNIMTDTGKAERAGLLAGVSGLVAPAYINTGTGTTAPAATDSGLVTNVGTVVLGTKSRVTTTVTNDTYQVVATNSYSAAYAITEAGLREKNDVTEAGLMWCRNTFTALNVDANTSIQTTWKIKMT